VKVNVINEDEIVVFLNKNYFNEEDFENSDKLEKKFKTIFKGLTNYNIEVNGYYIIDLYIDKYYGYILNIKQEDVEYYSYFDNQIDMKINIKKTDFLYEIDYIDLDTNILKDSKILKYQGKIYLKIDNNISDIVLGCIIEKSKIIYKNTKKIINNSEEVRLCKQLL